MAVVQEITPTVHHLFDTSLNTGALPDEWKSAMVTAIYKQRGSRNVVSNYHPISLLMLSNLSKLLESIVFMQLLDHVDHYLPIHQSGFRKGDNTTFQLVHIMQKLSGAIETGQYAFNCFYGDDSVLPHFMHGPPWCSTIFFPRDVRGSKRSADNVHNVCFLHAFLLCFSLSSLLFVLVHVHFRTQPGCFCSRGLWLLTNLLTDKLPNDPIFVFR